MKKLFILILLFLCSCFKTENTIYEKKFVPYTFVIQEFKDSTVYYRILRGEETYIVIDTISCSVNTRYPILY